MDEDKYIEKIEKPIKKTEVFYKCTICGNIFYFFKSEAIKCVRSHKKDC